MTLKKILPVIVVIILVVGIAVSVFAFLQSRNVEPQDTGSNIGQPVDINDTPSLGACTIVTGEDLRAIMQNGVIDIDEPERSGVVAPNTNVAEQCTFDFTTPKSDKNSITVQVFNVAATENNEADLLDASWALDVDAVLPTFFKEEVVDGAKFAYLRVVNGGQIVLWTLQQPNDQQQFNLTDQRYVVYSLSERADYDAIKAAAQKQIEAETEPATAN